MQRTIGIVALGKVPDLAPKIIAAHVSGYLDLDADITPPQDAPEYAYDDRRMQYNAAAIIAALDRQPFDGYEKVIAVVSVDLFVPILTYVFGEAKLGGNRALVSLFRMLKTDDGHPCPASLVYERTAKAALHELGHLYNLLHCENSHCLMHFSGKLDQLDRVPPYFCRYCSGFFKDALRATIKS